MPLLSVTDLTTAFATTRGEITAIEDVSFTIDEGEILGIVGESGSGKSVTALTIMGLLPQPPARVVAGEVRFAGNRLTGLSDTRMQRIRGPGIAMVFQEPMTSLNPVFTIGEQVMETIRAHERLSPRALHARALEMLEKVGIPSAARRMADYPHQLSGGQRQRVMLAIALACRPRLLIADEPTTALDVTIQAQILELMKDLSRRLGIALVIITHNLGIVARYADRVNVMYAARIVEQGSADDVFLAPAHPYAIGLMRSIPRLDVPRGIKLETIEGLPPDLRAPPAGCRFAPRCPYRIEACTSAPPPLDEVSPGHRSACIRAKEIIAGTLVPPRRQQGAAVAAAARASTEPLLIVDHLKKYFTVKAAGAGFLSSEMATVKAVDDVSIVVHPGETLGLVGESGCGKTTVGRAVLRLDEPTEGSIRFGGADITHAGHAEMRGVRRKIQVIFQDPYSSLNPRMTIGQIIGEPLRVYKLVANRKAGHERVAELLSQVGLFPYMAERYPHELSGGQRQRVGIARALALEPTFIVCDEPVSALDVSIRAQILNLLEEMKARFGLTLLFIAHDLAVVKAVSDRVAVMYLGRLCEVGPSEQLFARPAHPYTGLLLEAIPVPDPDVRPVESVAIGEPPSPIAPPSGCRFRTRCPRADQRCSAEIPELREVVPGQFVACHYPLA